MKMAKLAKGDSAPAFQLPDQHGKMVRLADYKGRKLLLYFYPKANTSGCTTQAVSVRDAMAHLSGLGVDVLGISPDEPGAQNRFDEKQKLGFPLLSDPRHEAADAYGVWGEKSMYGKKYEGIIRSSFLIEEQGKVIQAWYKVSPKDTVPKALAALSASA